MAIPYLSISESPRERGVQHGRALGEGVHGLFRMLADRSMETLKLTSEQRLLNFTAKHLPYIQEYAPDMVDEMQGIAEGAEIEFEKVLFLNCFEELAALRAPGAMARLATGNRPPAPAPYLPVRGCTAFACLGSTTTDGHVYAGQGLDMDNFYRAGLLHVEAHGDEPEMLMIGRPGFVGGAGINAAGLCAVVNGVGASDAQVGVPYAVVIRKALQQTTPSQFVAAILAAQRTAGETYIIGTPTAAIILETTATAYDFQYVDDGAAARANHLESPALRHLDTTAPGFADTLFRSGRMLQLLKQKSGWLNLDALRGILRDHENYPRSICRHDVPPRERMKTITAIVFDPASRRMLLTPGNPCQSDYESHSLTEGSRVRGQGARKTSGIVSGQ